MKLMRGAVGWAALLCIFVGSKLIIGCTAAQKAEVKQVISDVAQCVPPSTANVEMCRSQGGALQWCVTRETVPFLECLWQKHLKGGCETGCPFHTSDGGTSPDGGV